MSLITSNLKETLGTRHNREDAMTVKSPNSLLVLLFVAFLALGPLRIPLASATEAECSSESGDCKMNDPPPENRRDRQNLIHELETRALGLGRDHPESPGLWNKVLELHPRNSNAYFQLGLKGFTSPDDASQYKGVMYLEKAFDPEQVDMAVPLSDINFVNLLSTLGRWRWERREYYLAEKHFTRAFQAYEVGSGGKTDVCTGTSIATLLHPWPMSMDEADRMAEKYVENSQKWLDFLNNPDNSKNLEWTPIAMGDDSYVHCVSTIFHLSFYYRTDVAKASRLHYEIVAKLWPDLLYNPFENQALPSQQQDKPMVQRKIRLGVGCGAFWPNQSVPSDFKGVLSRLDRSKFEVTYIHFNEKEGPVDPFVFANPQDRFIDLRRSQLFGPKDTNATWVKAYRPQIEALNLDIMLYLDLTMSTVARRMGMAKLAPVQANTHGHPMTSGMPSSIIDYFISWEAAELEHSVAQTHYTEKLVFLPKNVPHQYYTPRSNGTHSLIDGGDYQSLIDNKSFIFDGYNMKLPSKFNWYVCMQVPHKFHPEVDALFCGVLQNDPDGHLVLRDEDTSEDNARLFRKRLQDAGCDMERVHFSPRLMHSELLALASLATVILDSYPAGGCTTTREVLELGKIVVTLPARLLGGRWSAAYYSILGDEALIEAVVADSEEDYIKKAVRLGTHPIFRTETERRIQKSVKNLYGREEAVSSWESVLLQISPVRIE